MRFLRPALQTPAFFEETVPRGDRIDVRRIWTCPTSPEKLGFYGAEQVFVVERTVIPKSPGVKDSCELNYAVSSHRALPDRKENAAMLLKAYRGHWTIENKSHHRRDRSYDEDRNPTRSHNAARVFTAFKQVAIFLCEEGAHKPDNVREQTLPELHRFCAINGIDTAINWIKGRKHPIKD